jgi:hypothetical protein
MTNTNRKLAVVTDASTGIGFELSKLEIAPLYVLLASQEGSFSTARFLARPEARVSPKTGKMGKEHEHEYSARPGR